MIRSSAKGRAGRDVGAPAACLPSPLGERDRERPNDFCDGGAWERTHGLSLTLSAERRGHPVGGDSGMGEGSTIGDGSGGVA